MRQELSIGPAAWLATGPIVIQDVGSVLATFRPGSAHVVRFTGPHTLYRAGGWDSKKGELASAFGSWWADALVLGAIGSQIDKFESWLPESLLRQAWPAHFRGAAALCVDWNDMREMFKMEIPSGEDLVGLAGTAAPQPRLSTADPKSKATPMLPGGGEQVYFKRTLAANSVNPLWVYPVRLW